MDQLLDIYRQVLRNNIALVVVTRPNEPMSHATGVLVAGKRNVLLLTAAHVVAATARRCLYAVDDQYPDFDAVIEFAPGDLDVAAIILKSAVADVLRSKAVSASDMDDCSHPRELGKGTPLIVAGFPLQFSHEVTNQFGNPQRRNTDIVAAIQSSGCDQRFVSFDWKGGQFDGDEFPFSKLGLSPGQHVPFKKPSGLSGAPVFRVDEQISGIMSRTPLRLCAIASQFSNGREQAIPIWRWRNWIGGLLD